VSAERTKWFPNETPNFDVQTSMTRGITVSASLSPSPSALRGVAVAASAARPRDPGPGTRGGRGTRGRARSRAGGQPLAATRPAPGAAPGQPPAEGQRSRPRALPHAVVSRIVTRVGRTPGTERGDRGGSTAARARRAAGHEEAAVGRASRVPRSTRARPLVAPDARDACPRAVDADTTGPGAAPEVGGSAARRRGRAAIQRRSGAALPFEVTTDPALALLEERADLRLGARPAALRHRCTTRPRRVAGWTVSRSRRARGTVEDVGTGCAGQPRHLAGLGCAPPSWAGGGSSRDEPGSRPQGGCVGDGE